MTPETEPTMHIDGLILVSVDDHVVEPKDRFEGHIPAKYKDLAPKVIAKDDGTDASVFEGQEDTNVGLNAVAGRPPDEYGIEPTHFSEMQPGCYDINERIRDMNANAVLAHVPKSVATVGALRAQATDVDLGFRSSARLKKTGTNTVSVLSLACTLSPAS
jgi:hypothetical protein